MGESIKKVVYSFILSPHEADCLDEALVDLRVKYLRLGMAALKEGNLEEFEWKESRGDLVGCMINTVSEGSTAIQEEATEDFE